MWRFCLFVFYAATWLDVYNNSYVGYLVFLLFFRCLLRISGVSYLHALCCDQSTTFFYSSPIHALPTLPTSPLLLSCCLFLCKWLQLLCLRNDSDHVLSSREHFTVLLWILQLLQFTISFFCFPVSFIHVSFRTLYSEVPYPQ